MSKLENYIFAEKYRPDTVEEIIIPEAIKAQFRQFIADKQIPNLLLTSPSPGTGKTTSAYALCHDIGVRPLFINASIQNSVDDIRSLVMDYATTMSLVNDAPKIVILDEADRLSIQAQDAMKGVIELVSKNCRFILTANTASRLTEPLLDRLTVIDFTFTKEDMTKLQVGMLKRVFEILDLEGITYKKAVVGSVVKKYVPSNRKLLGVLQAYSKAHGTIDEGILGQMSQADASVLIASMKSKNFKEISDWCMQNADRLTPDFYGSVARTLYPLIQEQGIPEMITSSHKGQIEHQQASDKWLATLAYCTALMYCIDFK